MTDSTKEPTVLLDLTRITFESRDYSVAQMQSQLSELSRVVAFCYLLDLSFDFPAYSQHLRDIAHPKSGYFEPQQVLVGDVAAWTELRQIQMESPLIVTIGTVIALAGAGVGVYLKGLKAISETAKAKADVAEHKLRQSRAEIERDVVRDAFERLYIEKRPTLESPIPILSPAYSAALTVSRITSVESLGVAPAIGSLQSDPPRAPQGMADNFDANTVRSNPILRFRVEGQQLADDPLDDFLQQERRREPPSVQGGMGIA